MSLVHIMESITDDNKKGSMIAVMIPKNVGAKAQKMFRKQKGDAVDIVDMHITIGLLYGESDDKLILKSLKSAVDGFGKFGLKLNDSFETFPPNKHNGQKYVLHAKPADPQNKLKELHRRVFDEFKLNGIKIDNGSFDFTPHMTIKYCDKDPLIGIVNHDPILFKVDRVAFANNGKYRHVKF